MNERQRVKQEPVGRGQVNRDDEAQLLEAKSPDADGAHQADIARTNAAIDDILSEFSSPDTPLQAIGESAERAQARESHQKFVDDFKQQPGQ